MPMDVMIASTEFDRPGRYRHIDRGGDPTAAHFDEAAGLGDDFVVAVGRWFVRYCAIRGTVHLSWSRSCRRGQATGVASAKSWSHQRRGGRLIAVMSTMAARSARI
jgi:hypothetical protein